MFDSDKVRNSFMKKKNASKESNLMFHCQAFMQSLIYNFSIACLTNNNIQFQEQRTFIRPKCKTERCKNSFPLSYVYSS